MNIYGYTTANGYSDFFSQKTKTIKNSHSNSAKLSAAVNQASTDNVSLSAESYARHAGSVLLNQTFAENNVSDMLDEKPARMVKTRPPELMTRDGIVQYRQDGVAFGFGVC